MTRWQRFWDEIKKIFGYAVTCDAFDAAREADRAAAVAIANQKEGVTISAWLDKNRQQNKRWACVGCALLTILFNCWPAGPTKDHCSDAVTPSPR